jgi:hypothetical protein
MFHSTAKAARALFILGTELWDCPGKEADMRWKRIEDEPKVFALVFETGDEIASVLQHFSKHPRFGGK